MDLQRFAGERTERATPRRREEARKKGQVARSAELGAALTLLTAFAAIHLTFGRAGSRLVEYAKETLGQLPTGDFTLPFITSVFEQAGFTVLLVLLPVIGASLAVGFVADAAQVGLRLAPDALRFDFGRINPGGGFKRIFSRRSLVELAKAVLKAGLLGWVVYSLVMGQAETFLALPTLDLLEAVALIGNALGSLFWQVGGVLLVLAALDYWNQRREFEESIKMTKAEVKQELRETEGDPQIRARIRERQRAMAQRRMMQDVAKADVVITNPTHYAVALRYEARHGAPQVVGKGRGHVAARIRAVAAEHGVPLVENPPLARSLHAQVELGDFIPPEFYQAVAEVLAFVYKQRGRTG